MLKNVTANNKKLTVKTTNYEEVTTSVDSAIQEMVVSNFKKIYSFIIRWLGQEMNYFQLILMKILVRQLIFRSTKYPWYSKVFLKLSSKNELVTSGLSERRVNRMRSSSASTKMEHSTSIKKTQLFGSNLWTASMVFSKEREVK